MGGRWEINCSTVAASWTLATCFSSMRNLSNCEIFKGIKRNDLEFAFFHREVNRGEGYPRILLKIEQ